MSGQQGREAGIVEAVRTPIGRGHPEKGDGKDTRVSDRLGAAYKELIGRAGIDPAKVEDRLATMCCGGLGTGTLIQRV